MLASVSLIRAHGAAAQIVDRYFPATLPGYESDLTLPLQAYDTRLEGERGVEIGDFNLQPTLDESTGYNSNPLGDGSRGSSLIDTSAAVSLGSDWARDALDGRISVENTSYLDRPIASQTNWTTSLGGSLDVGRTRADLAYSHLAENLSPTDLGALGITTPVPFQTDDVRLDDDLVFGRVRLVPAFEFENFSFGQSVQPIALDYTVLDHQTVSGSATGLLELSTGRSLVAIVRGTSAQYGAGASPANYTDLLGFAGIDFEADAPFRVRALAGGESRTFNSIVPQAVTTPTVEIDVIWQPTRLTELTTTVSRRLEDATSPFAGSEILTQGRIEIDHALRRTVELSAFVAVGTSDFTIGSVQNPGSSQFQTGFGTSATWALNRHVKLSLAYDYNQNSYSGVLVATNGLVRPANTINTVTLGVSLSD